MKVFADTSGLFALLIGNDAMHARARDAFARFAEDESILITSSFVLVELTALLFYRSGPAAVEGFQTKIMPLLEVIWADAAWYAKAMQRFLLQKGKPASLVDCLSFEIMESLDIPTAFSFDEHFEKNGFRLG